MMKIPLIALIIAILVQMAQPAVIGQPKGKEKIMMAGGPKVVIKSLSLEDHRLHPSSSGSFNTQLRRRMTAGSDLHEIFLTPYRYIEKDMRAVVTLIPASGHHQQVEGVIQLKQGTPDGGVTFKGNLSGLVPGKKFSVHVHELGDIREGCRMDRIGNYYNPYQFKDGVVAKQRHAGDLGNIRADRDGRATFSLTDKYLSLVGGRSIIGRSVVIHMRDSNDGKDPQEMALQPVACGVIGRST